MLHKNTLTIYL